GARLQQSIDRSLEKSEESHATIEYRGHIRSEESPSKAERHAEGNEGPEKVHLEPLRLEHRDTQIHENQDRDAEQQTLDGAHTRSSPFTRPSMRIMKITMPAATRKSPI